MQNTEPHLYIGGPLDGTWSWLAKPKPEGVYFLDDRQLSSVTYTPVNFAFTLEGENPTLRRCMVESRMDREKALGIAVAVTKKERRIV